MSLLRSHFPSSLAPATCVGSNADNKVQVRLMLEGNKERIKKMFEKVEVSISCYDTAWVAMIPSPTSPKAPFFPQCLKWLLENQLNDGSWGLPLPHRHRHDLLTKDSLLSTLACVLSLKQWGVGELQTTKGLEYIESNIASALDEQQHSPTGFDIIFPHLIEHAQNLDLNLPPGGKPLESFIQKRDLELKRGWRSNSEGWKAYIAYISEGLGKSQNWEMAMKYQRKNGSLCNSPAATAAAYTHIKNAHCLDYLLSLLDKFGNAVPTVHPLDVYARIYMVDSLEKLGIDHHFKDQVRSVLDQTYRLWLQEEDDIFLEPTTCAMAFRLLRLHGYDVSSDALSQFSEDKFFNTLQGYLKDIEAVLELHKASQIVLHSNDTVLKELSSWTRNFLEEYLSSNSSKHTHEPLNRIDHEVRFAMRFSHYTYMDRILSRSCIEHYQVDQKRALKTSYSSLNLANKESLELAVEDFNHRQVLFREEFEQFNRWFVECELDKLPFQNVRPKLAYCYLTAAATLDSPELGEARLTWAKEGFFTCVVDDFFDVWSSQEEQINLIQLMEKWEDVDVSKESCSEIVKLVFLALKRTQCEIADQAFKVQGRSVMSHLMQLWLDLMRSELKEAEWCRSKYVPTIDEYVQNGIISFALGPNIGAILYLIGPEMPEAIIESDECNYLLEVVGLYGRLLNDINGYQRDKEQGKYINIISLEEMHGSRAVSEEEIVKKIKGVIEEKRKELLRLVVKEEGSIVPRDAKDVFWKIGKSLRLIYKNDDVIHSKDMPYEALNLSHLLLTHPLMFT